MIESKRILVTDEVMEVLIYRSLLRLGVKPLVRW